jgi:hypothetical protein
MVKWSALTPLVKDLSLGGRLLRSLSYVSTSDVIKGLPTRLPQLTPAIPQFVYPFIFSQQKIQTKRQFGYLYPFFLHKAVPKALQSAPNNELGSLRPRNPYYTAVPHTLSPQSVGFVTSLRTKKFFEKLKMLSPLPTLLDRSLGAKRAALGFFSIKSQYFGSSKLTKIGDFHEGHLFEGPCLGRSIDPNGQPNAVVSSFLSTTASISSFYFKNAEFFKD